MKIIAGNENGDTRTRSARSNMFDLVYNKLYNKLLFVSLMALTTVGQQAHGGEVVSLDTEKVMLLA